MSLVIFFVGVLALLPFPAYGYIGPGLGAGVIGLIFGILFSIFLAVTAIFWYPIKRIVAKLRKSRKKRDDT